MLMLEVKQVPKRYFSGVYSFMSLCCSVYCSGIKSWRIDSPSLHSPIIALINICAVFALCTLEILGYGRRICGLGGQDPITVLYCSTPLDLFIVDFGTRSLLNSRFANSSSFFGPAFNASYIEAYWLPFEHKERVFYDIWLNRAAGVANFDIMRLLYQFNFFHWSFLMLRLRSYPRIVVFY